jgi:hypothetical protein
MFAAILRAVRFDSNQTSDSPTVVRIAYVRANEPLEGGHEAFAVRLGSIGGCRLHRKIR